MTNLKKLNVKFIIGLLVTLVIGFASYKVSAVEAPYPQWLDKYFSRNKVPLGQDAARRAKALYDPAVNNSATSTNGLGVYLPKNAVIVRSWYYVRTATTGNPAARVAFQCEDANNIKTATDMTAYSADTIVEGASTGAASAFVTSIGDQCQISAVLTSSTMSTGQIEIYVDYVIHD